MKFGDDPLGIHQPHIYAASTDTSLKMNQLAAKYLHAKPQLIQGQLPQQLAVPSDMSIGTKNYMERHRLLQGDSTIIIIYVMNIQWRACNSSQKARHALTHSDQFLKTASKIM